MSDERGLPVRLFGVVRARYKGTHYQDIVSLYTLAQVRARSRYKGSHHHDIVSL